LTADGRCGHQNACLLGDCSVRLVLVALALVRALSSLLGCTAAIVDTASGRFRG
jgi:hypothetical protein